MLWILLTRRLLRPRPQILHLRQLTPLGLRPGDLAGGDGLLQALPEVAVEDRLPLLGLPGAPLPAVDPAGGSVAQVVRAGVDRHRDPRRQALQRGDGAQQVELVGGDRREPSREHLLLPVPPDQGRPAPLALGTGDAQEDLGLGTRGGGSPLPALLLADLQRGELVRALVPAVAGVPLDPVPAHVVLLDQLGETAPEILVRELAALAPPAAGD